MAGRSPILTGTLFAIAAAIAFGVTTPFIQRFGSGIGPFTTAALLYLGAALGALPLPRRQRDRTEAALERRHLPRLFAVAVLGAAIAPTLFAWGLQQVPAVDAALLLNAEALFTLALAAIVWREYIGWRVALAGAVMCGGGALSVLDAASAGAGGMLGALAVIAAVLAWALDNVLTRPLADLDPAAVVRGKALLGATLTTLLALLWREPLPELGPGTGLLLCGASGYGLSLRCYLLAQRRIGAGRTGSVFAVAPFLGAAVAALLGDRGAGWTTLAAAALFGCGVALHLTERHAHQHTHAAIEHDHAHRHDDGHHDHAHAAPIEGSHAHPHRHGATSHVHPHGPDAHHAHTH